MPPLSSAQPLALAGPRTREGPAEAAGTYLPTGGNSICIAGTMFLSRYFGSEIAMGPLETAVMQRIWDAVEPQSVREVQEQISTERSFAYTTVLTVMDNPHQQGLLERTTKGKIGKD